MRSLGYKVKVLPSGSPGAAATVDSTHTGQRVSFRVFLRRCISFNQRHIYCIHTAPICDLRGVSTMYSTPHPNRGQKERVSEDALQKNVSSSHFTISPLHMNVDAASTSPEIISLCEWA